MLNRRKLISGLLGVPLASLPGCSKHALPAEGELLRTNFDIGHRIRDGFRPRPNAGTTEKVGVVIVGGGIAGLSAAWRLLESGFDDFALLELESSPAGTSLSGKRGEFVYPWGAHYVPVPFAESRDLIELLSQMGVVESILDDGSPVVAEQFLCRDPEERSFKHGRWHEGLFPESISSEDDLRQLNEFRAEIDRWVAARDPSGRRMFSIPMSTGSDSPEVRALDKVSMATWMDQHDWDSPPLRWLVDYACRDDYGMSIEQTSAWAGLFYFASRIRGPGDESQSVITWPEGNGRIVEFLARRAKSNIRCSTAVTELSGGDSVSTTAFDIADEATIGFKSSRLIFAAPQFLAPYLIQGHPSQYAKEFRYGSWLVANVHLSDRPERNGFPMCWDNVIVESKSLGYVVSTHQTGRDHGPTVLTWYYPFAGDDPMRTRGQMLTLGWSDWAELVLSDLRIAHPDIDRLVTRIDIKCWGHAMIRPRPGFVWGGGRTRAGRPTNNIHFANTDLSGIALCEEAFFHGVRAADEVLQSLT